MNFANIEAIRAAKTADLVAFYNANVPEGDQVKKFRDRATTEQKAIVILEAKAGSEKVAAAAKVIEGWNKVDASVEAASEQPSDASAPTGAWPFPKNPEGVVFESVVFEKPRASNSLGVAASWADLEVYAARLVRHGVKVTFDGVVTEHRSVREAFQFFRLPDSKHIRFRLGLKASGGEVFEHGGKMYAFTLVEAAAPAAGVEAEKAE